MKYNRARAMDRPPKSLFTIGNDVRGRTSEYQLELPFEPNRFAGCLVFKDEKEIQPWTIDNILIREGINLMTDLRRVPYFVGDKRRHKRINDVFINRELPVYYIGVSYFSNIDQDLPVRLKTEKIMYSLTEAAQWGEQVKIFLQKGACLLIVDDSKEVREFANIIVTYLHQKIGDINVKVNRAWSEIVREKN